MKILLLASGFNGLCQRVHRELSLLGHQVSVELALSATLMQEAVDLFKPDMIICPFLKERVPQSIWKKHICLIIHPGIEGDRGPSSLDWAIQEGLPQWGVTVLQAAEDMDAGDIWATANFPLREVGKASVYRRDVTAHAVALIKDIVVGVGQNRIHPRPLDYSDPKVKGKLMPLMRQGDRSIDWRRDDTGTVVRKINAADSFPGVLDNFYGEPVYLYGAAPEAKLRGQPGEVVAHYQGAVCKATRDGAVWIRAAKSNDLMPPIKLPAEEVLLRLVPEKARQLPVYRGGKAGEDIYWQERHGVGYLYFNFYNGAMNTEQCHRLQQALQALKKRPVKVIVLMGGEDFWSNGIHLNCIEAADDPAQASWENILAMNDFVAEIINTPDKITVAALRCNAGAGGAIAPLACDRVVLREGVVLNPHYATMGLYGSEYWTYLLPRRVGEARAQAIMQACMPMLASEALTLGIGNELFAEDWHGYHRALISYAEVLTQPKNHRDILAHQNKQRAADERRKPLAQYRDEELAHMRKSFYQLDSQYHVARQQFVHKLPATQTPARIALHRQPTSVVDKDKTATAFS